MPRDSPELGCYLITPEHFALERAELAKKRGLVLVKHAHELEEFDRQFDKIAQLETDIAALAERHAKPPKKKIVIVGKAKGKRATPSRPVPPRWSLAHDERILGADPKGDADLAVELGRSVTAVKKRRTVVRTLEAADHHEAMAMAGAPSSSEKPEIIEPTPAAPGKPESKEPDMTNSGFRQPTPLSAPVPRRATPATPVHGIVDSGPENRRQYGRGFESPGRE